MQEVSATFQYLEKSPKWDSEKPYYISGPLPQEQLHLRSNLSFSFHSVDVKDLRSAGQLTGIKEHVTVESHGFELATWKSPVPLTLDNEAQDSTEPYMAEVAKWLKTRFEAEVVISYAYRYRHVETSDYSNDKEEFHEYGTRVKPDSSTRSPHVGGFRRAKHHMSSTEIEKYMNSPDWRVRIINVWRPIHHPVEDAPLAFCDYRTISDDDLVASDRVSVQYNGEVYYLTYSDQQKWYFFSKQLPDEVAVFVSFDSDPGEDVEFCAHASFKNPMAPHDAAPRQSMEVRAIVVTPNTSRR